MPQLRRTGSADRAEGLRLLRDAAPPGGGEELAAVRDPGIVRRRGKRAPHAYQGRRGRRQHIPHSGAAASPPGTVARRKLDGRAGALRHAASIESSVLGCPKPSAHGAFARQSAAHYPGMPGGIALGQRCHPIYGLARASGQSKKQCVLGHTAFCHPSNFRTTSWSAFKKAAACESEVWRAISTR